MFDLCLGGWTMNPQMRIFRLLILFKTTISSSNHMLRKLIRCLLAIFMIVKLRVGAIISLFIKRQEKLLDQQQPLRWKEIHFHNKLNCPKARWGQAMTSIGNDIVLFGGYNGKQYLSDLWSFDNQDLMWTQIKFESINQNEPEARSCSSLHFHQPTNKVILFGGGTQESYFNDLYFMKWNGQKKWEKINIEQGSPVPLPRTYHSSNLIGKYLFVFGGYCGIDINDLWAFDMDFYQWIQIKAKEGFSPKARRFHSATILNEKLFIIGGLQKQKQILCIQVVDLNPFLQDSTQQLKWMQISNTYPSIERWGHSSIAVDQKILIFGGRITFNSSEVVQFRQKSRSLKDIRIKNEGPKQSKMRRRSYTLVGNSVVAFGGFDRDTYNNSFEYLSLDHLLMEEVQSEQKLYLLNSLTTKLQSDFQSEILVNKVNDYLQQLYFNHHKQKGQLLSINSQSYQQLLINLQIYARQQRQIVINDKKYNLKANRASALSDYFRNCFRQGSQTLSINLAKISSSAVVVCINFINTECPIICDDFSIDTLIEIAELSSYLSLSGLTDKIQRILCSKLQINNCDKLLSFSSNLNLDLLFRKCISFIIKLYVRNENILKTFRMPYYQLSKAEKIHKNIQIQLRQIRMSVLRQ